MTQDLSDDARKVLLLLSSADQEWAAQSYSEYFSCPKQRSVQDYALREIRRYLEAAKGDTSMALGAIRSTCAFRRHHRTDILRSCLDSKVSRAHDEEIIAQKYRNMVIKELQHQPIWIHRGKDGHALLQLRPCASERPDGDAFIYTQLYMIERALASSPKDKIDVVLEISGLEPKYAPSRKALQRLIYILQNHYPQRLRTLVVMDPPIWVMALYAVLSPFLDERTKKKFRLVRGSPNKKRVLSEFLHDPDQVLNPGNSDPLATLSSD